MSGPQVNILCNLTEMVVRHLEKAWVQNIRHASLDKLSRSLAAYLRPLLVLKVAPVTVSAVNGLSGEAAASHEGGSDVAEGGNWTIEFSNQQASELMGALLRLRLPVSI